MKPTRVYDEAKERLKELRRVEKELTEFLEKAPPGKIHIVKRGENEQYYLRTQPGDKSGTYISKSQQKQIRTFLQKSYCQKTLKHIQTEISNLERFLEQSKDEVKMIRACYSSCSRRTKQYLEPIDLLDEEYTEQWLEIPFVTKGIDENHAFFLTEKGERVRSKSELLIANRLFQRGIPYKYECPLRLNSGQVIYPDFTILDVKNRVVKYWEHRGMMDDKNYANHAVSRVRLYAQNGCYLGDKLIITEETSESPLGMREIDDVINLTF